jgi:SsrA-binding protein
MRSSFKGGSFVPRQKGIKPIAHNKKAFHEYFVEDRYECGMSLRGTEVKSVRDGRINLKESFCMVREGELFAEGMHISPYEQGSLYNADPLRPKKLLMHKSEIRKLQSLVSRKGYALIPLKVYLKDGLVKLELGLCRGKQLHDKRDSEQARDAQREMERAFTERSAG